MQISKSFLTRSLTRPHCLSRVATDVELRTAALRLSAAAFSSNIPDTAITALVVPLTAAPTDARGDSLLAAVLQLAAGHEPVQLQQVPTAEVHEREQQQQQQQQGLLHDQGAPSSPPPAVPTSVQAEAVQVITALVCRQPAALANAWEQVAALLTALARAVAPGEGSGDGGRGGDDGGLDATIVPRMLKLAEEAGRYLDVTAQLQRQGHAFWEMFTEGALHAAFESDVAFVRSCACDALASIGSSIFGKLQVQTLFVIFFTFGVVFDVVAVVVCVQDMLSSPFVRPHHHHHHHHHLHCDNTRCWLVAGLEAAALPSAAARSCARSRATGESCCCARPRVDGVVSAAAEGRGVYGRHGGGAGSDSRRRQHHRARQSQLGPWYVVHLLVAVSCFVTSLILHPNPHLQPLFPHCPHHQAITATHWASCASMGSLCCITLSMHSSCDNCSTSPLRYVKTKIR